MYTLLLRLAAPMQSWGTDSLYENRRTERIPTKSGIIGLIAAALGLHRSDDISFLRDLEIGVRVDQAGIIQKDYHTAVNPKSKKAYVTNRYYLSDAIFVVGVSSPSKELLERIEYALKHPAFPLYLGRRAFPPTLPLVPDPPTSLSLKEALIQTPYQGKKKTSGTVELPIFLTGTDGNFVERLLDDPITFSEKHREYGPRYISEFTIRIPIEEADKVLEHDVMEEFS
ncbi:MAG: type I-E CRISPR-associated protein Cas5/CasD [Allobaculum sp.]